MTYYRPPAEDLLARARAENMEHRYMHVMATVGLLLAGAGAGLIALSAPLPASPGFDTTLLVLGIAMMVLGVMTHAVSVSDQ